MKIKIQNLHKSYFKNETEIRVLRGIDAEIKSGDFISLTGPSGAGKSTLLHVLGTLDDPTEGSIHYDGNLANHRDGQWISNFRNDKVGFIFQFHHLLPEMTALENVMLPLLIRRMGWQEAQVSASKWLSDVGLSDRLEHKPTELSGGEQQRVALARAMVGNPSLLLADEPTGNLDEATGDLVFNLIRDLSQKSGITVVFVTHHTGLASRAPINWQLEEGTLMDPRVREEDR